MRMYWGTPIKGDRYNAPGSMTEEHFNQLILITSINSQRVIFALRDYFVEGCTRKQACERNNLSQGYFSISMRKFIQTNELVAGIVEYYISGHVVRK